MLKISNKKLSILVCTVEDRKPCLQKLEECLRPQLHSSVELIVNSDDRKISIGAKRNKLLSQSTGRYVCYVDDDDVVSNDYVESILKAIEDRPDVVGITLEYYMDNIFNGHATHSIQYDHWWQEHDDTTQLMRYYRNPNHLNPVKREFVNAVRFPDVSFGEDQNYSSRLLPFLKKETFIERPIYYYYFRTNK